MIKRLLSLCFLLMFGYLHAEPILRMSTTTSTEHSGLLSVLNPVFEKQKGVKVHVIAVGTGKALKLGENGDVDLMLVHAPEAEIAFINAGYGVDRRPVMFNDYVIVGPDTDPAQVVVSESANEAFEKIARSRAVFISRGDESGTHQKEKQIWRAVEIEPQGFWYISTGQGMGAVLQMADQKLAYALTDRGTYISYQDKIEIGIVFEHDQALFNPYHVIAVNPKRYPTAQYELAKQYIEFLIGEQGQALIAGFKRSGQQLFYPDAVNER